MTPTGRSETGRATTQLNTGPMTGSNGSVIEGNGKKAQVDFALSDFLHGEHVIREHPRAEASRIRQRVKILDDVPMTHYRKFAGMLLKQLRKLLLEDGKVRRHFGSFWIVSHAELLP
jgi:hypothetical protein